MGEYSLTILSRITPTLVQSSLMPKDSELGDNADGTLQIRRINGIPEGTRQVVVLRLWNVRRHQLDLRKLEFDFEELGPYSTEEAAVPLVRLAPRPGAPEPH